MPIETLAEPLRLRRGGVLPNRIAKAAMSEALGDGECAPTERLFRLYERLGKGGAGMLITGNVITDLGGRTEPHNVVITDARHLEGLRRWADVAQAHGSKLWMQVGHAGRQTARMVTWNPVGPSEVPLRGMAGLFSAPRALEDAEIRLLIERFANAAVQAEAAGFAGVQIHAAHGYLISQFLSPLSNVREDQWGGTPQNRMRFLLEIVRASLAATSTGFGVAVKLNSADFQRGGFTLEESMDVAQALDAEGIDYLEISGGNYERPAMVGSDTVERASTLAREAFFLEYAERMREVVELPLMLTGGLRSASAMVEAIESGAVDIIGLARPIALEPDLPKQILSGKATGAKPVDVKVGVRLLDDMLQTAWYRRQLERMGEGLEPDPSMSRVGTITANLAEVYSNQIRTAFRRDASQRLTEPA
ncbi:MAG: NADH:flavin oxidoreductase/NADH oxidase family protein [Deltaproteobacteria bacterium]